jgi:DNA-binding response OmpR family regulator
MTSQQRILVVDDNHSLVRVIGRLLEKHGFEVLTAFDGLQALRKAREARPDLIILDIVMPGMDGSEVCRHLEGEPDTATIPILMLTVKGRVDGVDLDEETFDTRIQERVRAFDAGAVDFLSKPVPAQVLMSRVRRLLWFGSVGASARLPQNSGVRQDESASDVYAENQRALARGRAQWKQR